MDHNQQKQDAICLCEEVINGSEQSTLSLTQIIRKCLRIARFLQNREAEIWFKLELMGYNYYKIGEDDLTLFDSIVAKSGRSTGDGKYYVESVPDMENLADIYKDELKTVVYPSGLSEQNVNPNKIFGGLDVAVMHVSHTRSNARDYLKARIPLLNKIFAEVYEWVVSTYYSLRFSNIAENIFNEARTLVETELPMISKDAAQALITANERLLSANKEEWSQGLTSCRRAMKLLADGLFPPQHEPSKDGHLLTDDKYINRLIEFVKMARISSTQKTVIQKQIDTISERIDTLNQLASKGVHGEVDKS